METQFGFHLHTSLDLSRNNGLGEEAGGWDEGKRGESFREVDTHSAIDGYVGILPIYSYHIPRNMPFATFMSGFEMKFA